MLDLLEPRQLMTVDLTGAFAAVPVTAPSGSNPAITFTLQNNGDTRSRGAVQVDFYAVAAGTTFSTTTATFLGRFSRSGTLAANGGTRDLTVSMPLSAALAAGNYQLVAVVDPRNRVAESDETNNVVSSGTIAVTQRNFDLTPTFGTLFNFPSSVTSGRVANAVVQVTITNPSSSTVNVPAGDFVDVEVVARPVGAVDASTDVVLNRSRVDAFVGGIQPGGSRSVFLPVRFPSTLAMGNFNIVARIDTQNALAETNETNNEVMLSTPMSVVAPAAAVGRTTTGVGATTSVGTGITTHSGGGLTTTTTPVTGVSSGGSVNGVTGTTTTGLALTTTGTTLTDGFATGNTPTTSTGNTPTNSLGLTLDAGSGFGDLTPTGLGLTPTASIGLTPVDSGSAGIAVIGSSSTLANPFLTTTSTTNPFLTTFTTNPLVTSTTPLLVTAGGLNLDTTGSGLSTGTVMF